jgi:hypothetical protein
MFEQQGESDDDRDDPQNRTFLHSLKAERGADGDSAAHEPFPRDEVI